MYSENGGSQRKMLNRAGRLERMKRRILRIQNIFYVPKVDDCASKFRIHCHVVCLHDGRDAAQWRSVIGDSLRYILTMRLEM